MTIEVWITVLVVGLLIVLSPGPQWMVTIKNTLSSKTHGMFTVWGMCSGSMVHILYCLLGIGIIISQSVLLFNLIKWLGAAYLIYLGVKALFFRKEEPGLSLQRATSQVGLSKWTAYRNGFFTSLLNPKATLFYLSLFTQVIHPEVAIGVQVFYGVSVIGIELIWYTLMVMYITHSFIRKWLDKCTVMIERASGAFLILFGVRLAFMDSENKS